MNRLEDIAVTVALYVLVPFALVALGVMLLLDWINE